MSKKSFLFLIIFLAVFCFGFKVHATTISPLIIELDLNPGESTTKMIKIFNESNENLFLNGYIESFKPKGENGEVDILPAEIKNQAIGWLKLPLNAVVLKPGEATEAPLMIDVPKTASVGGYYLAAMWESVSTGKDKQVNIASRVGTLILIRVKGEAKEQLNLLDFGLDKDRKFYSHLPVYFSSRLENLGNVHLKPDMKLVIENTFGRVATVIPLNSQNQNILPQSIRKFSGSWIRNSNFSENKNFWSGLKNEWQQFALGRYSASLQIEYGEKHQRISSGKIVFWVIPWRSIMLVVFLSFILFLFRNFLRRKKK